MDEQPKKNRGAGERVPEKGSETEGENDNSVKLTRRHFLKVVGVTAGLTVTGAGCRPPQEPPRQVRDLVPAEVPQRVQYPEVPYPPRAIPEPGPLRFFTPHEAQTVEAFSARLLPGTPEDPGAREAGVIYYMDRLLADLEGFAEPIYREPPFAETYEGDAPPEDAEGDFEVIWVPADEIERYGYQSIFTPREVFRMAVAGLDRYANDQFDEDFVDLSEDDQDEIIQNMVDGEATGFEPLSPEAVFHTFRRYTNEGMFSDPVYGGNRDMVGWKLIGYPGAQRAYTVEEVQTEGKAAERPVWNLTDLPHMHPGEPVGENTVLPVSGSEEQKAQDGEQ